ncbi:MAG: TonB-dependent receptor [Spirochaetota bacterium]
MRRIGNGFIQAAAGIICLAGCITAFAQQQITLSGTVYNGGSGDPVDFGSVVVFEAQKKEYINEDGTYEISVPGPGSYTVQYTADGLQPHSETLQITGNMVKDVRLAPLRVAGAGITITGERKQKLSRRTLAVEELEEVPASFGDSVTALTSLPGVITTEGDSIFGGPLVIRGVYPSAHRYYVDGVPMQYPQHFGGIHSVIANEMMSSVDLYSSAYPASIKGDLGGIIYINTLDTVDELGGLVDVSLLSTTALVKTPTYTTEMSGGVPQKKKDGYFIVSGRYGYLSLVIPWVYEMATGEKIESVPHYWDYQVKYKKYLNDQNSLTFMATGAKDWWLEFEMPKAAEDEATLDPLLHDLEFETDQMFHTQSIAYTYSGGSVSNTLLGYATLPYYYNYISMNSPAASSALKDVGLTSTPFEFTLKDTLSLEWWQNHGELNLSAEYNHYRFVVEGETLLANETPTSNNSDILGDDDLLFKQKIDKTYINHGLGGHIDNRFTFGGLTLVPQTRIGYLHRTGDVEVDPRMMASYEFQTGTTLSAASGKYHAFNQINPFNFQGAPEQAADGKEIGPEHAIHNSLGVEQKLDLFTVSTEGFYNYYYDLLVNSPHTRDGKYVWGKNIGEMQNYGAELMVRKDRRENSNDFFGWISYTYTQSRYRSGLPLSEDPSGNGNEWNTGSFEQIHSFKCVLGYYLDNHIFTAQFRYSSSLPFTPTVGSQEDPDYYAYTASQGDPQHRFIPVYSDNINSARLPATHRLDLRYSHRSKHGWGSVKWYVEVIDVTALFGKPYYFEEWRYDQPYSGNNPQIVKEKGGYPAPNLGVELRF